MTYILGIDPGGSGAISVLTAAGNVVAVHDMPSAQVSVAGKKRMRVCASGVARVIAGYEPEHAFVEQVGAMPGQGVSSMFSFGRSAGVIEGVLAALAVPVSFVTPQAWKKAMQVRADKGACRMRAMQLFPSKADLFARAKDDGRAEASMIGLYGVMFLRNVGRKA